MQICCIYYLFYFKFVKLYIYICVKHGNYNRDKKKKLFAFVIQKNIKCDDFRCICEK